jgi:uncharacterized membrane protein
VDSRLAARLWHGATFLVALFALVTQLILTIQGVRVLVDTDPPALPERLIRLVSYFTIQSNVLVAVAAFTLLRDPDRDGQIWRVVRVAGLVGITITGIVHWFLLRPLLDLTGWSYLCDKLLHVAVPLLAVVAWLLFGPRPRVTLRDWLLALIWPAAWLAYTLVRGSVTGFYPYPVLNVQELGAASVLVASLGITGMFVVVSLLLWLGDRRLPVRSPR